MLTTSDDCITSYESKKLLGENKMYVSEPTEKLIEEVAKADHRSKDGEIAYLFDLRLKEIEAERKMLEHNGE
jgi:hypothetical protein